MKKLLLAILICGGIAATAQNEAQKAKRLDSIFTAFSKRNQFNGSVLIAKKEKVLLSKGYGTANFTYDIPNSPTTKFKLASVSKQFTAMAILILQEKGLLSTDDKLTKFIPDYPNGDKITIHNLLTHTSGIPEVTSLPFFDSIMWRKHSLEEMIAYTKNKALDFEPGSKHQYSNSGYVLLTYIIEKASGKNYGDFMKANIFEPLGMKNSGLWHSHEVIKNTAVGYSMAGDNVMEEVDFIDMSVPSGAGALYSTVEDMYLWDRAFYTEKLVKKSTLEKMMTPFKDNYAYGIRVDDYSGHKMASHSGGIQGFATIMYHFPEDELYIVILKNVDNQQLLPAHRIARAVMYDQKYTLPVERKIANVDTKIFDRYIGEYELKPGFVFTVSTDNGKIFTQATGQPKCEIYPESECKYFVKIVDAQFEFIKDDKGKITSLVLSQGGANMPAKKIK
ncbi:MAG: CubicO group peptidase beta-lactamase class family [Bacteroidetes bacterium]|jgi:CubicO group peptidase (beta-lactamase class C family)|nr:CubicO group peptidase beta-lactamase class family [Bacteroidota bacterium]